MSQFGSPRLRTRGMDISREEMDVRGQTEGLNLPFACLFALLRDLDGLDDAHVGEDDLFYSVC